MSVLHVEVEDFVSAATLVSHQVGDPVRIALERLGGTLAGCGEMAGDDPGGSAWASSYDEAARTLLAATQQLATGIYRTADLLAASARNYAAAEAASTTGGGRSDRALLQRIPGGTCVSPVEPPPAGGGSGDTPTGWWLIQHSVGYVWPDGHQDRLHRAADAWNACADALSEAAVTIPWAAAEFGLDDLPEGPDVQDVCAGLSEKLLRLRDGHHALADACDALACHIDDCHREVVSELKELMVESAGIQLFGGIVSVVTAGTAGTAEFATQGVQAAKIAAVATRVGNLIRDFVAAARTACEEIPTIAEMARNVQLTLHALNDSRFAYAVVTQAPGLVEASGLMRMVERGVRLTKTARKELAATERLAGEGRLVPRAPHLGRHSEFKPPRTYLNRHGQLTNGRYTVSRERMAPHTTGSLASGKSQFFHSVDADKSVLDAASYAEKHGLFKGAKAKVYVENGPVGISGKTGLPTHWMNVYRTKTGLVHGCPGGE